MWLILLLAPALTLTIRGVLKRGCAVNTCAALPVLCLIFLMESNFTDSVEKTDLAEYGVWNVVFWCRCRASEKARFVHGVSKENLVPFKYLLESLFYSVRRSQKPFSRKTVFSFWRCCLAKPKDFLFPARLTLREKVGVFNLAKCRFDPRCYLFTLPASYCGKNFSGLLSRPVFCGKNSGCLTGLLPSIYDLAHCCTLPVLLCGKYSTGFLPGPS